jgi:hypothetical protein
MLMTITFTLVFLVAINFLLLIFSCNKTTKRVNEERKPTLVKTAITNEQHTAHLAPTGS